MTTPFLKRVVYLPGFSTAHLATKNDLRYYTARAEGIRDDEGHIIVPGEGITIVLLKRDRLARQFTDDVETLVLDSPSAFEFVED